MKSHLHTDERIMFKPSLVTNKFMGITHKSMGGSKAATPLRSLIHSTTNSLKAAIL